MNYDELVKSPKTVTPVKIGVHNCLNSLDSCFRRGVWGQVLQSYFFCFLDPPHRPAGGCIVDTQMVPDLLECVAVRGMGSMDRAISHALIR